VAQHVEPFGAALGANHPEFAAILGNEVPSDRAQYLRVVIDGEDERFDHESSSMIARERRSLKITKTYAPSECASFLSSASTTSTTVSAVTVWIGP
jgi:hypothetical protein